VAERRATFLNANCAGGSILLKAPLRGCLPGRGLSNCSEREPANYPSAVASDHASEAISILTPSAVIQSHPTGTCVTLLLERVTVLQTPAIREGSSQERRSPDHYFSSKDLREDRLGTAFDRSGGLVETVADGAGKLEKCIHPSKDLQLFSKRRNRNG